jgi:hypothetical protein
LPGHVEFHVQLPFGQEQRDQVEEPCLALMNWMFSETHASGVAYSLPAYSESDLFLAYRGGR